MSETTKCRQCGIALLDGSLCSWCASNPPPADDLPDVAPLTFVEAKAELGLLAVSYREGTMDLDEWCLGVHLTMKGYIAGCATRDEATAA